MLSPLSAWSTCTLASMCIMSCIHTALLESFVHGVNFWEFHYYFIQHSQKQIHKNQFKTIQHGQKAKNCENENHEIDL